MHEAARVVETFSGVEQRAYFRGSILIYFVSLLVTTLLFAIHAVSCTLVAIIVVGEPCVAIASLITGIELRRFLHQPSTGQMREVFAPPTFSKGLLNPELSIVFEHALPGVLN